VPLHFLLSNKVHMCQDTPISFIKCGPHVSESISTNMSAKLPFTFTMSVLWCDFNLSLLVWTKALGMSTTATPFDSTIFFSVIKNSEFMVCLLCLSVSLFASTGLKQDLSCDCFISVTTACLPFSPDFFVPCFKVYVWENAFWNVFATAELGHHCSHAPMCLLG